MSPLTAIFVALALGALPPAASLRPAPPRGARGARGAARPLRSKGDAEVTDTEVDAILSSLQGGDAPNDPRKPKYMPSTEPDDPIVAALQTVCGVGKVRGWELLDSRWNGNEALEYDTSEGKFFVKMNRVEHPSVFMSEAVSLSAIAKTGCINTPKPLHVGALPRVGDLGPGSFLVLEHLPLVPFGSLRPDNQKLLGEQIAAMHLSDAHEELHLGRFGFPVSNYLSLTPQDNGWAEAWPDFFARRLVSQADSLAKDKAYGRRVVSSADDEAVRAVHRVVERLPTLLGDVDPAPCLIHGDLWIGNTGATEDGPVIFDPAAHFAHSEFELSIMKMFGSFEAAFWDAYHAHVPKRKGFDDRIRLYQIYHYLNQLNLFGDPKVRDTVLRLTKEVLRE